MRAVADETSLSPYTTSLIKGQEKYLQVWTLGVKGMGDESDKLVTIDVDPASKTYGKVINYVSVGGRGEAHHVASRGRSTGHSEGAFCNHLAPPQPARTGSMLGRNSALATDNRVIRLRYQFIDQRRGRLATLKVGLDSG
jgi:hypothetical protein